MQRRKVLLPEPEAPRIEITSPRRAASEMPLSTSRRPKLLRRSRTASVTSAIAPFPGCLRPMFRRFIAAIKP